MKKLEKQNGLLLIPAAATLLMGMAAALRLRAVGLDGLLAWVPENPLAAALVLVVAYIFKSLSVMFPLSLLYLAAGMLFPLPAALAVSLLGIAAGYTVPYLLGRRLGCTQVDRLLLRYPRLDGLLGMRREKPALFAYALRVIGVVPFDIGSLLLGACRQPYLKGLFGSEWGILPGLLAHLLLARQLTGGFDGTYLVLMLGFTALSLMLAHLLNRMLTHGGSKTPH